jgi:hypothetical protein
VYVSVDGAPIQEDPDSAELRGIDQFAAKLMATTGGLTDNSFYRRLFLRAADRLEDLERTLAAIHEQTIPAIICLPSRTEFSPEPVTWIRREQVLYELMKTRDAKPIDWIEPSTDNQVHEAYCGEPEGVAVEDDDSDYKDSPRTHFFTPPDVLYEEETSLGAPITDPNDPALSDEAAVRRWLNGNCHPPTDADIRNLLGELELLRQMRDKLARQTLVAAEDDSEWKRCPDDGRCWHDCKDKECFRVHCCGPLSGIYPDNQWPEHIVATFGNKLVNSEESGHA